MLLAACLVSSVISTIDFRSRENCIGFLFLATSVNLSIPGCRPQSICTSMGARHRAKRRPDYQDLNSQIQHCLL